MKKVILTDDKNNTVHSFTLGSISCNHIPLDESEYEVVTDGEVECEQCIHMGEYYDRCTELIAKEIDEDILKEYHDRCSELIAKEIDEDILNNIIQWFDE